MEGRDSIQMNDGSHLSMSVVHVRSIPHNTVLGDIKPEDAVKVYRAEFARLLSEVYQWASSSLKSVEDCTAEATWVTSPASDQTFKSEIDIFLVSRAISDSEANANRTGRMLAGLIKSFLSLLRYSYEDYEVSQYMRIVGRKASSCKSLVKGETVEKSAMPMMDAAYTFGHVSESDSDFSALISHLSSSDGSIVHFQITPTVYSDEERSLITNYLQMANVGSKGIITRGMGAVSFSQAEAVREAFQPYYDQRSGPLYVYSIVVRGKDDQVDPIISQVAGFLNSNPKRPVRFESIPLDDSLYEDDAGYFSPWTSFRSAWKARLSTVLVIGNKKLGTRFRRLPFVMTVSEASEFFRLPIGSDTMRSGFVINESDMTSRRHAGRVLDSSDVVIGSLRHSPDRTIGVGLDDLTKHVFVCGTPGSGKTSFCIGLLHKLWSEFGIPFMVLEPAKTEYRTLIHAIPELQIFTPGKDFISPFVFNPFLPPENVTLGSYKSTLHMAFSASATMASPLDILFDEAMDRCYSEHRWVDSYRMGDGGEAFDIMEFVKAFKETFEAIGYVGEASNIGRAGLVRLSRMVRLFDSYSSIPIKDLLSKPTVIEFAAIEDGDLKALYMALILLSILSYVNANYDGDGRLKNIVAIEESHVLMNREPMSTGNTDADPSGVARSLVQRMLAESRAYGIGMLIADQSPRKVGLDVVAMTDMKVAFRTVESNDRRIIGDSINLDDQQKSRLAKFRPGEAFFFYNRLEAAEELAIEDGRAALGLPVWVGDGQVSSLVTYWKDNPMLLRPYPECAFSSCCGEGCEYGIRVVSKHVSSRLLDRIGGSDDAAVLKSIVRDMPKLIRDELNKETYSDRLYCCVKVHFWRGVEYNTGYRLAKGTKEEMIRGSRHWFLTEHWPLSQSPRRWPACRLTLMRRLRISEV